MKLPQLNEIPTQRDFIGEFKGYNHNLQIGEGEFYDMKNLTSTYYPVLSPRRKRGTYITDVNPQGMISKDALCYVDGEDFVINEYRVNMELSTDEDMCPKQLISMGAYVIIMPDKKWINTLNLSEYGDIEATYDFLHPTTFSMCKIDGSAYTNILSEKPENPSNMDMWLDTSTDPHSLKQWSESSSMWIPVATTYVKISSPNIGLAFEKYDGITIEGLKDRNLHDKDGYILEDISLKQLAALDGSAVVWDKGDDYIVVVGILDYAVTVYDDGIKISRKMPNMDFIVESENRLFGCKYGEADDGKIVNEIYASKLGDFKNWNCFMGLSTDSYAASCGTDGMFTGAITHLGYPLFFKENCVHKMYGNYPANFQIQTTACRGVQQGCNDSLAIVNEVLYYKSRNGICAYDGSLPVEVSYQLGNESYSDAVAAAHGNKYYISMKDNNGVYHFFVYDTARMLWHKEDNLAVKEFCSCQNELYYIAQDSTDIKTMFGSGTEDDEVIKWMAESGVLGMYTHDRQYISKLNLRVSLDVGTKVRVYIQYDSCGEWELVSNLISTSIRSFSVPIRPRRCDHFKIKIEGEGDGKIYSISKTLEEGSDL